MKRILYWILLLIGLFKSGIADTTFRGHTTHPDYPGQCYYTELQMPLPINRTYNPVNKDLCIELYCRDDLVLQVGLCSRYMYYTQDGCQLIQDYRKPFPACCPHYECKQDVTEKDHNQI